MDTFQPVRNNGYIVMTGLVALPFQFTLAHDDPISVHVHHPNSTKQRLLKRRGIVIPKEKLFAEEDSFDVSYEIRLQINRGYGCGLSRGDI